MEYDEKSKNWIVNELLPPGVEEIWPNKGKEKRVWLWAPENFTANPTWFKYEHKKGEHCIYKKRRPNRVGVVPNTVWSDSKYSANEHGSGMIVKIFGSTEPFDFAKSVYTVADCISVASDNKNALILDFFSGSGTTFHSTALLNSDDGGSRRCVLVANNELKENVAKEMNAAGFFQGDAEYEARGIAESVTWPRCKYVINGKRDDGTPIPGEHLNGRNLSNGFEENFEYARLDFLDSASVARGDAFQAILPILWMMAGCQGQARGLERLAIMVHSQARAVCRAHQRKRVSGVPRGVGGAKRHRMDFSGHGFRGKFRADAPGAGPQVPMRAALQKLP